MPHRFHLFPREESFYQAFLDHAKILEEAALALKRLLEEYQDLETRVKKIEDLEHDGDVIVREVSLRLYKTFITPIDREDVHALISTLDDALDYVQAAASRLFLLGVQAPRPPAHVMAELLVKSAREIRQALSIIEGNQDVSLYTEKIKAYEREGDEVNRQAVSSLFHDKLSEIDILRWMSIYDRLETALDKCAKVALILESVMLKNA
jgi:predicted phosphate transport protein (TIGR00153 family)